MPTFHYQAYTAEGELVSGAIEAASQSDATRALNDQGLLPFKTDQVDPGRGVLRALLEALSSRLSLDDYAEVTRQLSVLLIAGLPLDQALRVMTDQAGSRSQTGTLVRLLLESVTAGVALSDAIEQHASGAPNYLANLIRAGEARGSLGPTLAEVANFLQKRADIRARIRSGLTYPLVLVGTALAAGALIITVLVPAILPLFSNTGMQPPVALIIADRVGGVLSTWWPAIVVFMALVTPLSLPLFRRERTRHAIDRLSLYLPFVGVVVRLTNVGLLARTLGTLLRNGVALVPALTITASVVQCRPFAIALKNAADGVREGRRLSGIISEAPDMPMLLVRFITIGEEASKLDEMLLHLADISDVDSQRQVDKLMAVIPSLVTIVIGVMVGGLIVSVMQAILSVNQLAVR